MNKKVMAGYAAGFLTAMIIFGATAVFANTGAIREIFFGVNVVVDGVPQHFDYDMRPFIMQGRTFLPVRGIADAFGVGVEWDAGTSTVSLSGSTPVVEVPSPPASDVLPISYTWLDQMGHNNYRASGPLNTLQS